MRPVHSKNNATDGSEQERFNGLTWTILFLSLAIWVARRLGAFSLWSTVTTADGERVRFPNGFAIVDHPFHAVRAESLRRSLADGDMPRWIGNHQGGYPVEFYPLGVAALDVVGWALAFGSLPMMAVHKIVVIAIFLLPVAGYLLIAGFDRRSLGVALLAGTAHLSVRGWWWSGGSMELIEWGLVTNVAAVTALLVALPLAVRFLERESRIAGAGAALLFAFALVANPRSGIALVTALAGSYLAVLMASSRTSEAAAQIMRRALLLVGIGALLAAPEIVSLIRFNDLYVFIHYSGYANFQEYWDSSIQAVGGLFFVLGIAGFLFAWLPGARLVTRAIAGTLAIYVAGTSLLVSGAGPSSLIEQLETTRLMPFQRLLWLFLAASAVEYGLVWLLRTVRSFSRRMAVDLGLVVAAGLVLVFYVISPPSFIPEGDRGLVRMPTSAQPGIVDLEQAVKVADGEAAPGTALLVLGTTLSWHDQLWAPLWSDRPMFYDDWLWFWQTRHYGAYNPLVEHAYPSDSSALEPDYLARHGIGAIIVTGTAQPDASAASYLTLRREGIWNVYLVNGPTPIVTIDGSAPTVSTIENQNLTASGVTSGGEILVRRNWFPRWNATISGERVEITQTADGYMTIAAPAQGQIEIELTYAVDWIDWVCRFAVVVGLGALVVMTVPRSGRFQFGASSQKNVPRSIPRVQSVRR